MKSAEAQFSPSPSLVLIGPYASSTLPVPHTPQKACQNRFSDCELDLLSAGCWKAAEEGSETLPVWESIVQPTIPDLCRNDIFRAHRAGWFVWLTVRFRRRDPKN